MPNRWTIVERRVYSKLHIVPATAMSTTTLALAATHINACHTDSISKAQMRYIHKYDSCFDSLQVKREPDTWIIRQLEVGAAQRKILRCNHKA
jgi:hypothetical protein